MTPHLLLMLRCPVAIQVEAAGWFAKQVNAEAGWKFQHIRLPSHPIAIVCASLLTVKHDDDYVVQVGQHSRRAALHSPSIKHPSHHFVLFGLSSISSKQNKRRSSGCER
jgi:hypothetical protein